MTHPKRGSPLIKHIVAFRFRPDVPDETVKAILEELTTFPQRFPAMKRWTLGPNISKRDTTFTHAFVVEFDTEKELTDYLDSDEHETFIIERWRPNIEQRAIISFRSES